MTVKRLKEERKRISLYDIIKDETIHARAETNDEVVMALTNVVTAGEKLPPVVVFYDGEHYWLADGFYRYEAHILGGRGTIPAIILPGGRKEALFHALKSNANHGLRRSNEDKRKAVTIALTDPEMQGMSDNEIAKICNVSQPFVSKIRRVLTQNGYKFETTRICADGRIMNVSNIGTKQEVEPVSVEPDAPEVGDNNDEEIGPSDNEDLEEDVDTGNKEDTTDEEAQDDMNTPPETTEDDAQDLNLYESENNEGVPDADEITDPQITEDDPEYDEDQDTDDNLVTDHDESTLTETDEIIGTGESEDEEELELEDDDTEEVEESETGEESTVINDTENDDLETINDPDILKSMIAQLRKANKDQDDEIVDLKVKVEKLEEDVEYLEEQLHAHAGASSDVSAYLDNDSMDEENVYSMA